MQTADYGLFIHRRPPPNASSVMQHSAQQQQDNVVGGAGYGSLSSIFSNSDDRLIGSMIFDCVTTSTPLRQNSQADMMNVGGSGNVYGNSTSDSAHHYVQQQQQQQQHMYTTSDFDDMNCYSSNDLLLLTQQNVVQTSSPHTQYAAPSSHYYTNIGQCSYGQMTQQQTSGHQQQQQQDHHHQQQQQQHHRSPYGQTGGQLDYTNIDNLEPSLLPGQMDHTVVGNANANHQMVCDQVAMNQQQQQQQHMNSMNYQGPAYYPYHHSSPTGSSHTSSGTDLSEEGDDLFGFASSYKRTSSMNETDFCRNVKGKRQGKKRKPKRDPNEPQKPVSAYALFFRDTQATIKGQNPNASFGEVSKIVASMWDGLDFDSKNVYKQKTETAKKDYLKQLAAYRANLLSKTGGLQGGPGQAMMDPYSEMTQQQKKLSSLQSSQTNLPDSTTAGSINEQQRKDACAEFSGKSLASLIAEPAPQQVLTATTTLTVPQSYVPTRGKIEYEQETGELNANLCIRNGCSKQATNSPQWDREYCSNECVVKHCRDVFSGWVQNRQQSEAGTYAPV